MATVEKKHLYKVYSPLGVYLGLLGNVSSDFSYNHVIASAFAQTEIEVAQSADTSDLPVEAILDETGNPLTDESGVNLLIERQPDVVGSGNSNALIANNNIIKIYEFSTYYPNGLLVFWGYMSKWKAAFGGDDNIKITCISNGQDLSNLLISSGDVSNVSQATDDGTRWELWTDAFGSIVRVFQTFTVASTVAAGAVDIELTTPEAGTLTVKIYQMLGSQPNPSSDTLVASGSTHLGILSTKTVKKTSFSSFPSMYASNTYYISANWENDSGSSAIAYIYASAANPYANGRLYGGSFSGSAWLINVYQNIPSTNDAYFVFYSHGGAITGVYTNVDVSAAFADVISSYNTAGGLLTLPSGGLAVSGTLTTYTFKIQTVLQGLQSLAAVGPATWYWATDVGSGEIKYAQASTTADLTFIRGRHIGDLEIEATKENIKNNAYFTGGDDGTGTRTNIFVNRTSDLGTNRRGLVLLSDNRVDSASGSTVTARQIADSFLAQNAAETYITTVVIRDETMDTNLIKLGMMIALRGYGNFVDSLLLQVVGINKQYDQVTLQLGTLPIRASQAAAQAASQLAYLQTVANPTTPS